MNELSFNDIKNGINCGNWKYYNFYNVDIDNEIYYCNQFYLNNKENDEIAQNLHTLFIDIEVLDLKDFEKASGCVSSIVTYSTFEKIFKCYFFLKEEILERFNVSKNMTSNDYQLLINNQIDSFKTQLLESKHINISENVELKLFNNEQDLLIDFCTDLKSLDPVVLSGFYSDTFDWPYIYKRLIELFNKEKANKLLSRFNYVEVRDKIIKIPEYVIADLAHLYKPRGDGGLNYGKKRASYSLDFISNIELGLKKFDYKENNLGLDDFYYQDPINYLLYNIIDVALCVRLNDKLKHIELHNTIRRIMKSCFSKSMIGNSVLFDSFILNEIGKQNKKVRYGIQIESNKKIDKDELSNIIKPKTKKGRIEPASITSREYNDIVTKFDGAYVKESYGKIINDTSLIIDLDATGLYPSMMLQHNISFDVYRARIISPLTYKFLDLLNNTLGKENTPSILNSNIFNLVDKYINRESPAKKEKSKKNLYYIIMHLITILYDSKVSLQRIFNPSNDNEAILLIQYLIPLLDVLNNLHPQKESYNDFVFNYLFDQEKLQEKFPTVYIINNINLPNQNILTLDTKKAIEYISKFIITSAGTCFVKHQEELGIFTNMLNNMSIMRNKYKSKLKEYDKESQEYTFNNNRQLSIKVLMNSCYGVMGLSSFKYSNHWLAHSITTSGRLSLKIAQHLTEEYLKNNYS